MDWCERCGEYFIVRTQRHVTTGIGGRGVFREPGVSVCDKCLKYGEWVDETGLVRDDPQITGGDNGQP